MVRARVEVGPAAGVTLARGGTAFPRCVVRGVKVSGRQAWPQQGAPWGRRRGVDALDNLSTSCSCGGRGLPSRLLSFTHRSRLVISNISAPRHTFDKAFVVLGIPGCSFISLGLRPLSAMTPPKKTLISTRVVSFPAFRNS